MYIGVSVQIMDMLDYLRLGSLFRKVDVKGFDSQFSACFSLHSDIALRVLSAPNYDYCKSRNLKCLAINWEMRENMKLREEIKDVILTLPYFSERRRTSSAISDRIVCATALPSITVAILSLSYRVLLCGLLPALLLRSL